MKKNISTAGLVVAIICSTFLCHAQTNTKPSPSVSTANWQGNKKAAVCVTFDDGCVNQFAIGQAVLDSHNIKGTFNIITDLPSNCDGATNPAGGPNVYGGTANPLYWAMLQKAINVGHEIGAHTVHHPYLGNVWADTVNGNPEGGRDSVGHEISKSKVTLEKELYESDGKTPYSVLTFAYPYGSGQDTIAIVDSVQKYFIAAREAGTYSDVITWDTYADPLAPPDFNVADDAFFDYYYQVESYAATDTMSSKWFARQLDSTIKYSGWFIPMYHNIGGGHSLDSDLYTVSDTSFYAQMDSLVAKKDSLWIAPFRDVARYSKEKISSSISIATDTKLTNDSIMTIYFSDTIKNPLFNVPLTVLVSGLGCTCSIDSVKQGGKKLVVTKPSKGTIQFEAIPDSGNIIIYQDTDTTSRVTAISTPSAVDYFELYQNVPNPTSSTTTISYYLKQGGTVTLELFDINGTTAKTLVSEVQTTGKHSYSLSTDNLSAGIYFYRLTSDNAFDVKKMVIIK